jgi:hypothetical protein
MSREQPIEFFHPGLGSITCTLQPGTGLPPTDRRLIGARLDPAGDVLLEISDDGNGVGDCHCLVGVEERVDGTLVLQLAGAATLTVPANHAARARDVVLSLANRITPYF